MVGLAILLTLIGALARYAIDLLGIVFLIIVVGFSLRAISDWLTEGDSVSGWSIGAVVIGLAGTMAVGTWLFGSASLNPHVAFASRLPGPVVETIGWLETRGWGQRVLLRTAPEHASAEPGMARPGTAKPGGGVAGTAPIDQSPLFSMRPPDVIQPSKPRQTSREARGHEPGTAEAASVPSGRVGEAARAPVPSATRAPAPLSEPGAAVETATVLESASLRVRVGTSVRLTATVRARGARPPTGEVVFYRGDEVLGSSRLRRTRDGATATFSTLELPIGTHSLSAHYPGSRGFAPSRSAVVQQVVSRR